ncbi:hypothetical protein QBC37DRAFT_306358 [Rhypophila decipiens]|uniref:BRCT domain-containing protein n=1 Tax=Rhypophila decipiens TaxID=261697 RepID=A0AAN6YIC9_9PEZI|nr:hypothetical protein QBC37DRAFT_306358 [Rhypophila decipiens]
MDPQSPPKRMTRARAAAKSTTEPATKTTRIVTAASKAKATRSTATAPTSSSTNKRKIRHDDAEDEDPLDAELPARPPSSAVQMKPTRATRGRPKKVLDEPAPESTTATEPIKTTTRGRPKKTTTEPAAAEPAKAVKPTTRTKKAKAGEEVDADADVEAEPPKKAKRGRAAASTMASRQATRPTVKKSVKFEEPEKENIAPRLAAASKSSTKASEPVSGLRARPIRRPAAAAGRTARGGSTKSTTTSSSASDKGEKPLPLSPKKVNQLTMNKAAAADSDDELAMNDKPLGRSLTKNPIKPPVGSRKQAQIQAPAPAETADHDSSDEDEVEPHHTLLMATPAKRPPPSPWKNVLTSPPKRVEGILAAPVQTESGVEGSSKAPSKMSLLQSPAKRIPVLKNGDFSSSGVNATPMKMSLLSSPAKRSFTPMRPFVPVVADIPEAERTPAPKPTILSTPLPAEGHLSGDEDDQTHEQEMDQQNLDEECDHSIPGSPTRLQFPGRLSAVLPRHADPVFKDALNGSAEEMREGSEDIELGRDETVSEDHMVLDNVAEFEQQDEVDQLDATSSANAPSFGLRQKDLQPFNEETDSEDELSPSPQERTTTSFGAVPSTPCPASSAATPRSRIARSTAKRVRTEGKFGFTPLADQLSGWTAGPSPLKTGIPVASPAPTPTTVRPSSSAENKPFSSPSHAVVENQYFEDEMMIRQDATEDADFIMAEGEGITPVLEDIPITEEDVALAAEANEMSLMEPEQIEELIGGNQMPDDSISEASQEYGDENAIPIDPALVDDIPPATPQRIIRREFHTVSKIPLKPAAEESPRRKMRTRSQSVSRLPVQAAQRPTETLNRSATVISYSAPDRRESNPFVDYSVDQEERASSVGPLVETPQKTEVSWSTMGTPARTPRRDLDPALLRGAVVFVDVHTSEGADASSIFVDLLSQMGARCVKSWSWNPSSPCGGNDGQSSSSKIGITHVVYKDGGKRTLEKVRESGGVVQCVGVSWVLDCERENRWLDEVPYYIDTALVPRGGARRRKSMEPRALANMNGTLIPTPVRNSNHNNTPSRQSTGGPSTPASNKSSSRRRESALWIRTPEQQEVTHTHTPPQSYEDFLNDDSDMDWNGCDLTPVPKTPAPETIARYAANINPDETPTTDEDDDEDDQDPLHMPSPGEIMTRTCPPKASSKLFSDLGAGRLQRDKDEGVLMRLMAARRKSLQFAPKVASPLSKAWY